MDSVGAEYLAQWRSTVRGTCTSSYAQQEKQAFLPVRLALTAFLAVLLSPIWRRQSAARSKITCAPAGEEATPITAPQLA